MFEVRPASRKAVPLLISLTSVSGGGKTYSALLLAAGLAGKGGKVGMLDTENGRGEMYTDSPAVMQALPHGFMYARFDPPYSPQRYIEGLQTIEKAGVTVAVVDSGTHEWDGIGGVTEMAESEDNRRKGNFGRWASPKIQHKRFMYWCASSKMHIIFCLRGAEKTKQFKAGSPVVLGEPGPDLKQQYRIAEKDEVLSLGVQAVCEKNFIFEMMLSLYLEEKTHWAIPIKVPEPLVKCFPQKHLITQDDGARIREWNDTGVPLAEGEQLEKRARVAAEDGITAYQAFFQGLSKPDKKHLANSGLHAELKAVSERADKENFPQVDKLPDPVELVVGSRVKHNGALWEVWDDGDTFRWREVKA